MKYKASFTWLFVPVGIYLVLLGFLFVERSGMVYEIEEPQYKLLEPSARPQPSAYTNPGIKALILFDGEVSDDLIVGQTYARALDNLRVNYELRDIHTPGKIDFTRYRSVILAFREYNQFVQLNELVSWVKTGGRVLAATPMHITENFMSIYHKMGVISMSDKYIKLTGLIFTSDLFPGGNGIRLEDAEEFQDHVPNPVQMEETSRVHITSTGDYPIPLLWQADYEQGRFVVVNTDLFNYGTYLGVAAAAYTLLEDVFIYPVINSSIYFIDDFPAPIAEGKAVAISQNETRDYRNFLLSTWWPDMLKLADKYGLKYTGLLVETYNSKVTPPFNQDISVEDQRYLGRLLLKHGGEIGLHGYNHIPLCQIEDGINHQVNYVDWPSKENQEMAIKALAQFGPRSFPRPTVHFLCAAV